MEEIENSFAGNICRCTGYRPIADAFKSFACNANRTLLDKVCDLEDLAAFKPCGVLCAGKCRHKKTGMSKKPLLGKFDYESDDNGFENKNEEDWCILHGSDNKMIVIDIGDHKWYKTYSLDEVFKAMGNNTDYKLIAGNTGQGVYHVTDYPQNVIDVSSVSELRGYFIDVNLVLGAGMPLAEMMDVFKKLSRERKEFSYLKEFYNHMDLVAHVPVRNIGTIGGNLFMKHEHNDFQSDVFLLFETVGATISIGEANKETVIVYLKDFLKINMKGKIILNVKLPPLSLCCLVKTYKIMPRSQNAHAHVNAGFMFRFDRKTNKIAEANIVFGSISPTFIHATKTEALLVGKYLFTNDTLQLALKTLADEIKPEASPAEPSTAYRKMLAISLFYKAILSLCPDDAVDKRMRSGGSVIKRSVSQGTQTYDTDKSVWPLNQPIPKIEALVQCAGEAVFANDLPAQPGEVYGALVLAKAPAGSVIDSFDAAEALKLDGVVAFYTAKDIPGKNSFVPVGALLIQEEEEILCSKIIKYFGQPVAIIVANREKLANKAANMVKVKYATINKNKPLLTIEDVLKSPEKKARVVNNKTVEPTARGNDIKCIVTGEYTIESQYHYFMEPQTCVVKPTEDGMEVHSATQWLDLTNTAISEALNVPANRLVQLTLRKVMLKMEMIFCLSRKYRANEVRRHKQDF
ncbi:Xanthine dehydrogenase 2 [Eumeta japonica]|uniref:Xanthine dehydrogenase 2 n=1 Tax=Eumeta variegata TaxID=151549 RepID=A0A4C1ZXK4_EUMVA|nr:Xanthine dehydrogenase 2 [Eumeta japonica]